MLSRINCASGSQLSYIEYAGEGRRVQVKKIFFSDAVDQCRCMGQKDVPVSGMALTLISQMSSLPLNSTNRTYLMDSYGELLLKEMTLWTEGLFVNGYIVVYHGTDPTVVMAVSGDIREGKLHLHFGGVAPFGPNMRTVFGYIISDETYDPASIRFSGVYSLACVETDYTEISEFTAYIFD